MNSLDDFVRGTARRGVSLDTSVALLYIVGRRYPEGLGRLRRVEVYSLADYELLTRLLAAYSRIATTPNVLTEVANLLDDSHGTVRTNLLRELGDVAGEWRESYFSSVRLARSPSFPRLELTDTSLLVLGRKGYGIVTTDSDLWGEAQKSGYKCVNFNHLRFAA